MQSYDECLYFIYPRNYNLKLQKQVLQGGFVASIKAPSLVEDSYVQTFTEEDVAILEDPSGINLAKLAANWSDGVILGSADIDSSITDFCREKGLPVLEYNAEALENGSYIDDYNSFYDNL